MSEERLKILTMLQEGKITVEEAERLLNAVKEKAERDSKKDIPDGVNVMSLVGKVVQGTLSMVPGIVFAAIKGTPGEFEESIPKENINKIELSVGAGDVDVRTSENDFIHVKGEGKANIKKKKDMLKIDIPFGDAYIEVPLDMPLWAEIRAGDVRMKDVSFPIKINMLAGDAEIKYKKLKDLHLEAMAGDVRIFVPEDASFKLSSNVPIGSLTLPDRLKGMKFPIEWGNPPFAELYISLSAGDGELHFIEKEGKNE